MIEFHIGREPGGFKKDFESFLFNTHAHRVTQSKTGWKEFHLLDKNAHKIMGSVAFHVQGKKARSPLKAPFGGFEISTKLKSRDLKFFITQIEKYFTHKKIDYLELICPPELLTNNQRFINTALMSLDYHALLDVGCCIPVDESPLQLKMMPDKLARLKKTKSLEFRVIPIQELKSVYQFIEAHFEVLDRKLSLSYSRLAKIVKALPNHFFLVGVFHKNKIVTANICLFLTPFILYTFYSAHDAKFNIISPRVFLIHELYQWSQRNKIKIIDLGTSMLDGKINSGLLDFKVRMGGIITNKYTFHKFLK